jgi:hypothetical protein
MVTGTPLLVVFGMVTGTPLPVFGMVTGTPLLVVLLRSVVIQIVLVMTLGLFRRIIPPCRQPAPIYSLHHPVAMNLQFPHVCLRHPCTLLVIHSMMLPWDIMLNILMNMVHLLFNCVSPALVL